MPPLWATFCPKLLVQEFSLKHHLSQFKLLYCLTCNKIKKSSMHCLLITNTWKNLTLGPFRAVLAPLVLKTSKLPPKNHRSIKSILKLYVTVRSCKKKKEKKRKRKIPRTDFSESILGFGSFWPKINPRTRSFFNRDVTFRWHTTFAPKIHKIPPSNSV